MDVLGFLEGVDIYSWKIITVLIIAGFLVGFINTVAGSGTVITYSLFMWMGLPASIANGTVRLGVIAQTLVTSLQFRKEKLLDIKKGIFLGIPVTIGSITGAQIAISIDKDVFEKIVAIVMLLMLVFICQNPNRWVKGKASMISKKTNFTQAIIFFATGLYGGFIHIGVGIFLIFALVLNAGYDLVKANGLKVFIVLLYSPFALAVFMYHAQIHYGLALISAIGNIIGGYVGTHAAISWGATFVKWVLVVVIILFASQLLGVFNI